MRYTRGAWWQGWVLYHGMFNIFPVFWLACFFMVWYKQAYALTLNLPVLFVHVFTLHKDSAEVLFCSCVTSQFCYFWHVFFSVSMNSPDMLAAEMPKRRPSFRTQLSRSSRISDSFTDRDQLLANTSEEIEDGKTWATVAIHLLTRVQLSLLRNMKDAWDHRITTHDPLRLWGVLS